MLTRDKGWDALGPLEEDESFRISSPFIPPDIDECLRIHPISIDMIDPTNTLSCMSGDIVLMHEDKGWTWIGGLGSESGQYPLSKRSFARPEIACEDKKHPPVYTRGYVLSDGPSLLGLAHDIWRGHIPLW
jgi:hypothetical protein